MSDRYPRYRLLTGPEDDRFWDRVSAALDLGYELHGAPSITTADDAGYVAEALVWTATPPPPERPANALASLDHCVIHVSEWERSNAFYRDVLGADLVERRGRLGLPLR